MLVLTSCNIFSKSDNEGDFGDTNVTNPGNDITDWKDVVVSANDNYVITNAPVFRGVFLRAAVLIITSGLRSRAS